MLKLRIPRGHIKNVLIQDKESIPQFDKYDAVLCDYAVEICMDYILCRNWDKKLKELNDHRNDLICGRNCLIEYFHDNVEIQQTLVKVHDKNEMEAIECIFDYIYEHYENDIEYVHRILTKELSDLFI